MRKLLFTFLTVIVLLLPNSISARTSPEDIINSQKDSFNQKLNSYSAGGRSKITEFDKKIADLNRKQTTELEALMVYQGAILEEYMRRHNVIDRQSDGVSRNLSDPVENARYWLTYAHEAVAFQAGKIYILNLTSEANIKRDIQSTANALQNDISVLKNKVIKSQNIIEQLVSKN